MSSTVSGVHWKANYGEISDDPRFRIGKVESNTWEASWPISELVDVINVLQGVSSLPVDVIEKGTWNQARKVYAGFFTDIIVEPRLDTGVPSDIIRFGEAELTDLLYVFQLLAAPTSSYPVDATVTHNGKTWVSLTPFNVWEPPVGWREQVADGYSEWVQPSGAHDAYAVGARVTHAGQDWENTTPANVYEPGIYGWTVI